MITEKFFPTKEALLKHLLDEIETKLSIATAQQDKASLLVSGGSSPAPLYRQLSHSPLDWEKITIALVDERWVATDDNASNQKFLQDILLQNKAQAAHFVGMKNAAPNPTAGLSECEQRYRQINSPWDLLILGMGEDGHIASLFPAASGLATALDTSEPALCAAISANKSAVTGNHLERLSLSLRGILNARQIILLIQGEAKKLSYQRARSVPIKQGPVRAILDQSQTPITVYWCPDEKPKQ